MTSDEMLQQLGAFDPRDAKKLIAGLERHGIPFEMESDHSAVASDRHWMSINTGVSPQSSKLVFFVPEKLFAQAMKVMRDVFPG
jgi:hypothetical protein